MSLPTWPWYTHTQHWKDWWGRETGTYSLLSNTEVGMVNRCDMSSFPWVQWFNGRTHRTQHTVILMATNYIIRKTQSKISKGKRLMGSSLEETRHSFQEFSPAGVTRDVLNSSSKLWQQTNMKCCLLEAHQWPSAQGFYWGLVTEAPSAQHVPNFQTLGRKAGVQHKPHHTYSLGTINHFHHLGKILSG